ncbi:MAG: zinc finger domain-containing protein [Candidatus Ranarchaeia archaeon]
MSSTIKTPLCSCCGKTIEPTEYAVHFSCPECGKSTIWRCERCRKSGNTYKCVSCNFEGP